MTSQQRRGTADNNIVHLETEFMGPDATSSNTDNWNSEHLNINNNN